MAAEAPQHEVSPAGPVLPDSEAAAILGEAGEYEKFLGDHPCASAEELIFFLKERGLDMDKHAPQETGVDMSPISVALTDDPRERYLVNTYLSRELMRMEQQDLEELGNEPREAAGDQDEHMAREYFDRVETEFMARFAERVVGFSRAAALLEAAMLLQKMDAQGAEGELSFRAEAVERQLGALGELFRRDVYERGEFGQLLEVNKNSLRREVLERAASIHEEDARTIFTKAFNLDFATYTEIFLEKPKTP